MRLDKYLSGCGKGTRSDVKKLIKSGVVTINDVTIKKSEQNVNDTDVVCVNGEEIKYREFVYLMLNKPQGYVSATEDREHKTVLDLIGEEYAHFNLFPVGRLDIDTEGLLLLTNDGAFAHSITSPKKEVYKTYFAILDKEAQIEDIDSFKNPMEFKDFTAKSAILEITDNKCEVYIKIYEGKFHQVKRMCERVGKNVVYLKRVAIGNLLLDSALEVGEYRELSDVERNIILK